jgi:DNA-binding GntR family transcriptional regulator
MLKDHVMPDPNRYESFDTLHGIQHRVILRALNLADANSARDSMQAHLDFAYDSANNQLETSELQFPGAPKPGGQIRKKEQP